MKGCWKTLWNHVWHDLRIVIRIAWMVSVILVVLSVLHWYGFSEWSISNALALVSAISWDHLLGVVVLFSLIRFETPICRLIDRIKTLKKSKDGWESTFDPILEVEKQQSIEAKTQGILTIDDVKQLLPTVPHLDTTKIENDAALVHSWLLRNGIRTRQRLSDLVSATAVFDFLAKVYVDELRRQGKTPLDPVSVGTWGVALFVRGLREDVKDSVIRQIRQSPEYQR
jgi:hypothetical protein